MRALSASAGVVHPPGLDELALDLDALCAEIEEELRSEELSVLA